MEKNRSTSSLTLAYCRFRPFIKSEIDTKTDKKTQCSVAFHKLGKNVLLKVDPNKPEKYEYDRVFPMSTNQQQLFQIVGEPILTSKFFIEN